jgi:hypothetical protein
MNGLNMNVLSRRAAYRIGGANGEWCLKAFLTLLALVMFVSAHSAADTKARNPEPRAEENQDFYKWIESEQGQKASLAQMRQRCDKVPEAGKNLSCSVSVFTRMFEAKAANQLPEYYLAIKRRHARAIENSPELKVLFSMFGSDSLSTLRTTADFSLKRTMRHEVLAIHPYAHDYYVSEQLLPYIDVQAANGFSSRFILDTGAPQTRVNYKTARRMGGKLLADSHYRYNTFYGERDLPVKLGILRTLKIGGSEFNNVLVLVSDREDLLGLDLISKLGRLKITKKTLELNSGSVARCDSRVVYARMDINQRLAVVARLDHRDTMAIIDTGNVDYLTSATPVGQVNVVKTLAPGNSPIYGADQQHYQTLKGVLGLAGSTLAIKYKYYPDYTIPPSLLNGQYVPSILFGWGAFNDFELNLDIESGRSCFNKI